MGRGGTAGSRSNLDVLTLNRRGFLLSYVDSLPTTRSRLTLLLVALAVPQVLLLTGHSGGGVRALVTLTLAMLASGGRRSVLRRGRTGGPCTRVVLLAVTVLAWGVLRGFRVRGRTGGPSLAPGSRMRNRRGCLEGGVGVGAGG